MNKIIDNIKSGNYEVVDNQGVSVTIHFVECLEKEFADLETKLAESEESARAVIYANFRVIEERDKLKQQLADTEEQNKRVLEKLELIVRANQELEQKLAEKDLKIIELETKLNLKDKGINV